MSKGKLITKQGDITTVTPEHGSIIYIPHVCNDVGKFGAGVALAIAKKWPQAKDAYMQYYECHKNNNDFLGTVNFSPVSANFVVANMVAQKGLIGFNNPKPIKYLTLITCMKKVKDDILGMRRKKKTEAIDICCPKFGSLRSGGNWDFILELIEEIWLDSGIDVTVYEYTEKT